MGPSSLILAQLGEEGEGIIRKEKFRTREDTALVSGQFGIRLLNTNSKINF